MGRLQGLPGARRLPCHFCSSGSGWLVHDDGVRAEPAAPGHRVCRDCCTPLLQLPARVPAPCKHLQPALSLSLLSEQLAVGLFQNGWLLARKLPWKSLFQMCTAVCTLLPLHPQRRPCRVPGCAGRQGEMVEETESTPLRPWCHLVTRGGAVGSVGGACQSRHIPSTSPWGFSLPSSDKVQRVGLPVFPLAEEPPA